MRKRKIAQTTCFCLGRKCCGRPEKQSAVGSKNGCSREKRSAELTTTMRLQKSISAVAKNGLQQQNIPQPLLDKQHFTTPRCLPARREQRMQRCPLYLSVPSRPDTTDVDPGPLTYRPLRDQTTWMWIPVPSASSRPDRRRETYSPSTVGQHNVLAHGRRVHTHRRPDGRAWGCDGVLRSAPVWGTCDAGVLRSACDAGVLRYIMGLTNRGLRKPLVPPEGIGRAS